MGALRVMSYTFDILRAGKQNCALAEIFPLRTYIYAVAALMRIPCSPHKLIEWQSCVAQTSPLYIFLLHRRRQRRPQSLQARDAERAVAKVELICPTCGCPVVKFKESCYFSRLSIHREYRNCNQSPPPGGGLGVEPAPYCCAWVSIKTWCGSSTTAPLRTPRASSNAYNL
jgi:hypothetical protein